MVNFSPPEEVNLPAAVVSYWNFDEVAGAAIDVADGNNGALGAAATRTSGLVGGGAIALVDDPASYVGVGAGTNDNFAVSTGVTVEAAIEPNWDGAGSATLFRKAENVGATLLSYWSFDESNGAPANSSVLDSVGGNDGTLVGTATHTAGIRGLGAGRFNDDRLDAVSLGAGGVDVTDGITIAAWIEPEWSGVAFTYDAIYYKNDGIKRVSLEFQRDSGNAAADPPVAGTQPAVLSFGLNTGGTLRELDMPLGVNLSALPNGTPTSGTVYLTAPGGALGPNDVVLRDGAAHHVAATYDVASGEKAIWIDGVKRWFRAYAAGTPVSTGGSAIATIGNLATNVLRPFNGVIDEVAIWGDALSSTQIAALAGTDSPLTLPSTEPNNRISLELQNDGNNAAANPPVAAGPVLSFGLNVGGAYEELDMPLDGVAGRPTLAQLQDGNTHHVAATYDSATGVKAIWIDGTQRFSVNLTPGAAIDSGGAGLATIGNRGPSGDAPLAGTIDEVAFWNRALASGEVQQHATAIQAGRDYFADLNTAAATLAFNETAPGAAGFWAELVNYGNTTVQLGGHVIVGSENPAHRYVLPAGSLAAGGFVTITEAELGFTPTDGERLFLYNPSENLVIDGVAVDNELRGRLPQATGPWLFPDAATPGTANSFALHDEVVINEIMYHARPTFAQEAQDQTSQLVSLGSTWQYEQSDTDLGATAWKDVGFTPSGWSTGPGLLGASSGGGNYSAIVLADGPLAYWRLGDAGPAVTDASGNGRNGTADAGVAFGQTSLIGSDASNAAVNTIGTSRVTIGGFEKFPAGSTGYSVEYWIKLLAPPTGFHNIVGDGESSGDFYLMNYLTGGGQIRPHFNGAGTVSTDSNGTLQAGQTYHVVTTWDRTSGVGSIYINGALDKAVNIGGGAPVNTNNPIYLGKDNRETGGNFILDEVAIYNRAMNPTEIAEHFNAGGGIAFDTTLGLGPTTYYFRNEFTFDGDPASTTLSLRTFVDDGAVFYLNGQEIYRQNMPAGVIGHNTFASTAVNGPAISAAIPIAAMLQNGTNVLAVELHQADSGDLDVAFGAELTAAESIEAGSGFAESEEEWIELYNRSTTAVDLSNWMIEDAINYTFPIGTTIAAGEYLVLAKDPVSLAAAHPSIRILGGYSGQLSDGGERITLKDANKNPADTITYADDGRWSVYPDGGGSSLELRDPHADNALPEAWAASDETDKSEWRTYTYRGIASVPPNSPNPTTYNEFILGLLDAGEVLLDDISVRENPNTTSMQFLQNGTFQNDTIGASPATWRIAGTHRGTVVVDPDNAANKVLHLIASGQAEHLANHAETTLKAGALFETVVLGTEYEITFKAKWLAGSPQFNTRLFFNLLPKTTILETPASGGTPGERNSTLAGASEAAANIGPTFGNLAHAPLIPTAGEPVTVSIEAADPDGVQSMTLRYAVGGGALQSVTMTLAGGAYHGTIPGQVANAVVQFFVEGRDSLNALSSFPAAGAASRALYKVGTTANSTNLHNLQIIMTPADAAILGQSTNLMNNAPYGTTVVYEGRAYYDVGVRLKGSEHGRPDVNRRGFFLVFPPDDLFRGVHKSVGIDRSGGWRYNRQNGQEEIVIHHFINAAGGVPSSYNDLVNVEAPGVTTGSAILQMGRFTNIFLDSQYENGGDGTRWEYELIYTMGTSAGVESPKVAAEGPSVFGTPIRDKGDDKESYRNNFLIKNNTDRDDFSGIDALAEALGLPAGSAAYYTATQQVIDVDQWLRAFAAVSLAAVSDSYFNNSNAHNATFYQRPSDGKILLFPQDMDFAFRNGETSTLFGNSDLNNLLTLPQNSHFYLGHIQDIVATSYNAAYMGAWVNHYNSLLPGQNITDLTAFINTRANFALSQLPTQVSFIASANPPEPITTTIVGEFAPATAFVPSVANGGSTLGTTWTGVGFNDASWTSGGTGVGYETSPAEYDGLIDLDVLAMRNVNGSAFVRVPFDFSGDANDFDDLKLRMKYDDGFVAYLNGVEVARANTPTTVAWDSLASQSHNDSEAVVFQDFNITSFKNLLVDGPNVLAIHALNTTLDSSDLLILPALVGETIVDTGGDLVVPGPTATIGGQGWVNVREIRLAGEPGPVNTTWLSTTTWQATIPVQPGTRDYTFVAYDFQGNQIGTDTLTITSTEPQPLLNHLRISELMYHPADPTPAELAAGFNDADDFEFVEFVNTSATETLDLTGVSISDGISYTFGNVSLVPGGRILIVEDLAAFAERYGTSIVPAGQYAGRLNNAGEHLRLSDPVGNAILDFTYDDTGTGWHPTTDGLGYSLVIVDENAPTASWNDGASWRPSTAIGGSPGTTDEMVVGDITGDGRVGTADLAVLQGHMGITSGATAAMGDLNGDGAVNRADVAIFARQYGLGAAVGSPAAVAAPAAVVVGRQVTPVRDEALLAVNRRRVVARAMNRVAHDRAIIDVTETIDARSSSELTTARRSTLARRMHRAMADSRRS
ncbi:MAG: LamG-like jellyroll fold domain-containing protein [Pirellulales bacterium]